MCFTSSKIRAFSDNTVFVNDAEIGNAVQASCSFPTVFSPTDYNNNKLVDGGIRENVPWREVKLMGADKVLNIIFENNFFDVINAVIRAKKPVIIPPKTGITVVTDAKKPISKKLGCPISIKIIVYSNNCITILMPIPLIYNLISLSISLNKVHNLLLLRKL